MMGECVCRFGVACVIFVLVQWRQNNRIPAESLLLSRVHGVVVLVIKVTLVFS
jgi:hypothetical protein